MREPVLTRLEPMLFDRIARLAEVFGSNSDVLRLIVRVFFRLMDAGIIRMDAVWLQALLQENQENLRNRVLTLAREPVAATEALAALTPLPQRKSVSQPLVRQGAVREAKAKAYKYTSIQPIDFAIRNLAIGYGARA